MGRAPGAHLPVVCSALRGLSESKNSMNGPLIVAELSANHLGGLGRALKLINVAKQAGADAVKFQTYRAEEMVGPQGYVIPNGPWAGKDLLSLYRQAETPRSWHQMMFAVARNIGIEAFSTPFSRDDVDFLEEFDCSRYKIASFELVDLPLIRYAASKGKPLIMSTGMATQMEISEAVVHARDAGCRDITLLKCTSAYPAGAADANLATLISLRCAPGVTAVGLSDHTLGIAVPVAATALGASVIEKHLTLSRSDGGPDAAFSLEPDEFASMVKACRECADAIGEVRYGPAPAEMPQVALRRSLYFSEDLKAGEKIRKTSVRTARPALGLPPSRLDEVIGKALARSVRAGEPVTLDLLS